MVITVVKSVKAALLETEQASYFWKVVGWNKSKAVYANLVYAVDGL